MLFYARFVISLVLAIFACALPGKAFSSSHTPSVAAYHKYKLVFSDEFNGTALDSKKWVYRADSKHRSVQRKQNVVVSDGQLVLNLLPLAQPLSKKLVASGAGIISREKFHYGYYEVRARLGDGQDDDKDGKVDEGWHHAFWLQAAEITKQDVVGTTYPGSRRTEIDIYENPSEKNQRISTTCDCLAGQW